MKVVANLEFKLHKSKDFGRYLPLSQVMRTFLLTYILVNLIFMSVLVDFMCDINMLNTSSL